MEKINPIRINIGDEEYVLEFNRATVKNAEDLGFSREDAGKKLMNSIPQLFYFAFKMHHPNIKKSKTDSILFDDLGGLTEAALARLLDLYDAPYGELTNESGESKNPNATMIL